MVGLLVPAHLTKNYTLSPADSDEPLMDMRLMTYQLMKRPLMAYDYENY